jgi:hypothetical protein
MIPPITKNLSVMQKKFTLCNLLIAISASTLPVHVMSRTTSAVQIEEIGASRYPDKESVEKCQTFTPTLKQVTHYFDNAYPVEADVALLERATPCYATGSLRFNDGTSGAWVLFSSGTASFTFQRGDHVTFYYPHIPWYDPTNCTYGQEEKKKC